MKMGIQRKDAKTQRREEGNFSFAPLRLCAFAIKKFKKGGLA
jgi:hypothetical protein